MLSTKNKEKKNSDQNLYNIGCAYTLNIILIEYVVLLRGTSTNVSYLLVVSGLQDVGCCFVYCVYILLMSKHTCGNFYVPACSMFLENGIQMLVSKGKQSTLVLKCSYTSSSLCVVVQPLVLVGHSVQR